MSVDDKNRIAKNTLLLYIRMFFNLLISLYTSRVVLDVLGVEDYGIYNVVGGVVSMLSFLNSSMSVATQRFLTVELGKNDLVHFREVFNMACFIHFLLALFILLLAETIGVWFINTHLNIPSDRMDSVYWIFQTSLVVMFVGIIQTPYNASIIAHEHMNIYAYVGMAEVIFKLLIVYLLLLIDYDKLIVYGLLILLVQVIVALIYRCYCVFRFEECRLLYYWNKSLFISLLTFTGWNMFGTIAWILKDQGVNVLMNIFGGPVVNAARGISYQVSNAIGNLVGGFQTAVNPQITKNYAAGKLNEMQRLLCFSSKISFYLLFIIALPIWIEASYILNLWLVEVPDYAILFTRIVLCEALINTLSGPMITGIMATGKIKKYQLLVGGILLLNVPVSYLLLKMEYPIYIPFLVSLLLSILSIICRMHFAKLLIKLPYSTYLKSVCLPLFFVFVITVTIITMFQWNIEGCTFRLIYSIVLSLVCSLFTIYTFGLHKNERQMLKQLLCKIIKK